MFIIEIFISIIYGIIEGITEWTADFQYRSPDFEFKTLSSLRIKVQPYGNV